MAATVVSTVQQLFDSSARLVRTKWTDPEMLAQELFAIFRSLLETTLAADANNTTDTTSTDGTTTRPADNIGGVTVTKGDEVFNSGSGPDLKAIDWPGQNPADETNATPDPTLNPLVLYGEVVEKVSGSVYSVRCWAKAPTTNPPIAVLNVTQGLIDADETIPSGTPVEVVVYLKAPLVTGGPFQVAESRMQVPVWM